MNILIFLYTLLLTYWSDALLIVVVALVLAIIYKSGKKELVKDIIYSLVVKAEKELGSKTGGAKYSLVIANLYEKLPLILRLFFSKTELNKYIEDSVTWLKNKLKDPNVTLLSYAEESLIKATEAAPAENVAETVVVQPRKIYVTEDGIELTPVMATDTVEVAAQ